MPVDDARRVVADAIAQRVFPAAVVEVGGADGIAWHESFGRLTFDQEAAAAADDTIFDLASLTKPMATTAIAMSLIAAGSLSLDARLADFFDEWRGADREPVTVRDLLEHASGLPARLLDAPPSTRREFEHDICAIPLEYRPRAGSIYSDPGFILLGFLVERIGAASLAAQFAPIAAVSAAIDLAFGVTDEARSRTAPTQPMQEDPRRGRRLAREVHDNYAWLLGGAAGHAGLFGTAPAAGAFARMLLRSARGDVDLPVPFTPAITRQATTRSTVPGSSRALGWDSMLPTSSCGGRMSAEAFGHVGFTGTSLWIDPARGWYFVLLTNRVCGGGTLDEMRTVRRAFHDALGDSVTLTLVDWLVIGGYFALNLAIGLYYASRARGSTTEFFLSGRNVPWWLAGTSMVATTFAADTPLVVTGMVARYGIAGNWLWWNMAASGMLTVFVYARLWRRAGVMTDVEFAELRYSGRPAAFLRGFRALYLGIPINCIVMGWVNLAMLKILQVTLGLDERGALWALLALLIFTAFYTTLAGLWGVLVTDLVQFVLKMGMVVALAFYAVRAAGGLTVLEGRIRALDAAAGTGSRLAFFPSTDSAWMPAITLFVYLGVSWWASWYPGAEPGGGGYVAQRIFSARTERDGLFATLWFNIAHYAVRPWPWILTALASLVLYPDLVDKESGYVRTLMDPNVFPPALRGIMLAAFAAAYMSTIGTQLNWGASYVVNDFYRRFLRRSSAEREYVMVSQIVTVALMFVSIYVTLHLASIEQAWKLLIVTGAGTGTVLLLRWFWWRINAWSEVSAMAVAAAVSLFLQIVLHWDGDRPRDFAYLMIVTVGLTTIAWIAVTMLTPPEPEATLHAFYRRVRPQGPGWAPVASAVGLPPIGSLGGELLNAFLGCVLVYGALFGVGELLLRSATTGIALLAVAALAAFAIARNLGAEERSLPAAAGGPSSSKP